MRARHANAAAFAVAWLVFAQFAALNHEAAARHVTCAEHGEPLEGTSSAVASAVNPDANSAQSSRMAAASGGPAHHEHCAIAQLLRMTVRITDTPRIAVAMVPFVPVESAAAHSRAPVVNVVLIAPKTSPPA